MTVENQRMLVFVGSYAEESSDGVYVYEFDEQHGDLTRLDQVSGLKNPTFLNVDVPKRRLYAISETVAEDGTKRSDAVSFNILAENGKLAETSRADALNGPSCHIQRSANNRFLTLTSYHKGSVSLVELKEEGTVGGILDIQEHKGQQPDQKSHVHSSFYSPDQRFLFVCDLGLDTIFTYRINAEEGKLVLQGEAKVKEGAGPRHLVFHPSGKFAYVINELQSTVTAFRYDAEHGALTEIETVSTLPADAQVENGCAEITISEDGRFLYGSNRGHDSIVVYAVNPETGKLETIQHVSAEGKHPRHFSIVPGGRYVLTVNRDTNNLAVFTRNSESGKLSYTGKSIEISKPVCVWADRF
ncbi:beta-propeller fold lactonase family protein [Paenibacillus sp. HJL G12]|uniref:Beta-propeller fold lactonase family protein n=1 Tax=Paenibacillus dendrobii TaxID=2691084 RepID=A0A7X3IK20_9BACL|nr:lactonase family protein [Paenibacillus dendrobii]MWV45378.1 beta-propeller fold lactonase family protein [Paenibacillus dendrobii]